MWRRRRFADAPQAASLTESLRRSGLVGLRDRVTALHGQLRDRQPLGGGTVVTATIPLDES